MNWFKRARAVRILTHAKWHVYRAGNMAAVELLTAALIEVLEPQRQLLLDKLRGGC